MVSNPHRTDVGFGCENALHWHRLFILSWARLDCCTHLRQVELGPCGRGRVCGEGCGAQSCAHMAGKTSVMTCLRGACCETTPGLLHKLFILVTTSSQSKQPFPLFFGGSTLLKSYLVPPVWSTLKSHTVTVQILIFMKFWKIMEFKFFHQQENIRLLCNCSLLFFFINFI